MVLQTPDEKLIASFFDVSTYFSLFDRIVPHPVRNVTVPSHDHFCLTENSYEEKRRTYGEPGDSWFFADTKHQIRAYRRLFEYIENKVLARPGKKGIKKTEAQFWLDIEEILSHYRHAGYHHSNLSTLFEEYRFYKVEAVSQEQQVLICVKKEMPRTSKLHLFDTNLPNDPEFHEHGYNTFNQHTRKKTAQRVSSLVVSISVFIGILFDIWSQLSVIQPLHKEHVPLSVWPPLLRLLGFMVFVCAVATMILVRAPFSRMQGVMLIFWAILMLLKSSFG